MAGNLITLSGAPLVVKKRKTINVRMGGDFAGDLDERLIGKKDSITVDLQKQGISDIEYLLKHITIVETRAQIILKNFPTRLAVDNKENKPLHAVERKTEVTYGNDLEQAMIKFIERSLSAAIRTLAVNAEGRALASMSNWQWMYVENPSVSTAGVPIPDIKKLKSMRIGAYLVLKPRSNMAGVANMFAARKDAGWPAEKWRGPGRSGGRGFMAQSIDKMKRGNLVKNYIIHAAFTNRYRVQGEVYRASSEQGAITPVLVVRAKRNRRYKRII